MCVLESLKFYLNVHEFLSPKNGQKVKLPMKVSYFRKVSEKK